MKMNRPILFAAALLAGYVALQGILLQRLVNPSPVAPSPAQASRKASLTEAKPASLQHQLLGDFLKAAADQRSSFLSPGAEKVVAAYYAGRDPDEVPASAFRIMESSADHILLSAQRGRGLGPVIAAFRRGAGDRWQLDFPIYAQTYDCAFRQFAGLPQPGKGEFRVILTRLPDAGGAMQVRLNDPWDTGEHVESLVASAAPVAAKAVGTLQPGQFRPATVRVEWSGPVTAPVAMLAEVQTWGYAGFQEDPGNSALPVAANQ